MRLRLVLAQREDRGVPAVGFQARGVVDRQAEVVAELGSWNPVLLILVVAGGPLAGQVDLRERGACGHGEDHSARKSDETVESTAHGRPSYAVIPTMD